MVWNMTEDEDKPFWITNYSPGLRNCRDEQISGFSRWWVAVAARGAILFEAWQSADWAQRTQTDSDDKKAKLSLQPTLKCGLFNHNLEHPICHKQHFCWTVLLTWSVSWSEQNLHQSRAFFTASPAFCVSCLSMVTSVRMAEVWPGRESGQHWVTLSRDTEEWWGTPGPGALTQDTGATVSWAA